MSSGTPGLVAGSVLMAVIGAGVVLLVYNAQLPIALGVGALFGVIGFLLLRNREANVRKWEKNPTTFPSPLGGGLVGEYMKRPWRQELAEIGQAHWRKHHKKKRPDARREKESLG